MSHVPCWRRQSCSARTTTWSPVSLPRVCRRPSSMNGGGRPVPSRKKRGYTPSQAHLTLLAWNLFITNVPATVWLPKTVGLVYSFRWQVELVFKAWKSGLHLAAVTTTTKHSTLCYLYGRMLLILLTSALSSPLRATLWQQQRELSLLKLVRHFQAGADQWFQALFHSAAQLTRLLARACASAERLVKKELRKRPTSAQSLRESLGSHV